MTTVRSRQDLGLVPFRETAEQRAARLAAEATLLAIAKADIEGGRYIADRDIDAWLEAWEDGTPVALPEAPTDPRKR